MEVIDIIILVLVGVGIIQGLMKGFLKQLAAIVGLVAGLLIARALFGVVAEHLVDALGTSVTMSFILIWVVVPLICVLVASVLTKALDAIHLGWLNRLLGGLFGAVKVMLLIGLAIHVLEYIDPKSEIIGKTKKEASALYNPVKDFTDVFFPVLKDVTDKIVS